ncbi:peptidase m32 carboxypeptidase taq metallopeptidase [Lucifera butyrica]|uniref:Metal-dependent carboxypeptidase n=1 Tax=Lucifera butyrica TaxID=1351585 RepID=A0A498RFC2_9FIRM|nr:carboxypeptidase M32 [Lucifera butyrica]VBB09510.1 peptidase m32 carboxypeptidase taq metallopeptidase [Lucifera butyrica]
MNNPLDELKKRLAEISDLTAASAVLSWDQMTLMPSGGAAARARQLATMQRLAHEKAIDPEIGRLLEALQPLADTLPQDSDDASLIRVATRDYERESKIPPSFTAEFSEHASHTYEKWAQARSEHNFKIVEPFLAKTLDYSRQRANFYPGYEHIADPLIDAMDEGLKVSVIRPLFDELRQELIPLVQRITSLPPADDSCLKQQFSEAEQLQFGLGVAKALGYDFERGREDKSPHPFTTSFSIQDVRITTRVKENELNEALFSTIHETGHALYEQGINPELEATPLAAGTAMGIHESQSRLWENLVGRSRQFWEHFFPELQKVFPEQLGKVSLDTFYRAINKVQRSLIRTDADEVTYNLHVMIRFDLELSMLEGKLAVADLPEAWNERYRQDLGITPPDDSRGVLQDMHWYSGTIGGYFQSYTIGNVLSAQFFEAALAAHPEIPGEIAAGRFETLHQWLTKNIYQYGRELQGMEIVRRVTGKPMTIVPYIRYLKKKYGELYRL